MDAPSAAPKSDLKKLEKDLLARAGEADNLAALEDLRVAALGKNGSVTGLLKTLGRLAPEERRSFGQAVNALKDRVAQALEARKGALADANRQGWLSRFFNHPLMPF